MTYNNSSDDYLSEILDGMKQHFNKPENTEVDNGNEKELPTDTDRAPIIEEVTTTIIPSVDPKEEDAMLSESEIVKTECLEEKTEIKDESEILHLNNSVIEENIEKSIECTVNRTKKPQKSINADDKLDENSTKRSSRRRSKDCNESILQSAIARKEKSYNEANKPQRLTRRLKPTQKILDNIASAKQEKLTDYTPSSESSTKRLKLKTKRGKKMKTEDSDVESDSDGSAFQEYDSSAGKRRSQRLSRSKDDTIMDTSESPNVEEETKENPDQAETIQPHGADQISSRLCCCTQNTSFFMNCKENETVFCTAIDSIDDKVVGCSRTVDFKNFPMLRPSQRVPYGVLCNLHRNRLIRHNCCPTCGQFCTQGNFLQCEAKHQYHKDCQLTAANSKCCPHCGLSVDLSTEVIITMHTPKAPVFLPEQKPY